MVVAVDFRDRRRVLGLDLRPVGVELLGEDQRQRGKRTLPHFRRRHHHRHRTVGGDGHPGVEACIFRSEYFRSSAEQPPTKRERERERAGRFHEAAPADAGFEDRGRHG
jgi:hypothetical protein